MIANTKDADEHFDVLLSIGDGSKRGNFATGIAVVSVAMTGPLFFGTLLNPL